MRCAIQIHDAITHFFRLENNKCGNPAGIADSARFDGQETSSVYGFQSITVLDLMYAIVAGPPRNGHRVQSAKLISVVVTIIV